VAAIFGVRKPNTITLAHQEKGETLTLGNDDGSWPVKAGQHCNVLSVDDDDDSSDDTAPVVPMHESFDLLGGEDRVQSLSVAFYHRIWHCNDTPEAFRKQFFSVVWFCEVWGGPMLSDQRDTVLLPRMLARHTKSKMEF